MASVELMSVSKTYPNGFEAVRSLDLEITSGEFIALVGPSGCGKTTTLRMVAGLEEISGGTLRIDGVTVNDLAPRHRGVAMVFQSYALYPHMTVFENMAFGLRLQKVAAAEIDQRVRTVAQSLGIEQLLDRKPGQMSGGQRQRVAMGRAIVRRPKVFLFDEPLSNLDARLRLQMRMELGRLHRELGATSLYVTHDQVEAMTLADRIVLLEGGHVQQIGTPLELYETPRNVFTAEFIGSPTMNLWPARNVSGRLTSGHIPFGQAPSHLADGAEVTVGVRPHDLTLTTEADTDGLAFAVDFVEPLGHETLVHGRHEQLKMSVALDGTERPRAGDTVWLKPKSSRLHIFDQSSGLRL
ncbi:MAG: sn-glycerol-3-phosphate ABC transporter ATP-binding protein UgpC [Myxococcota bacterium]|nr:sn-glycerol-3-phosphate ABC transporter ATP-binding protein UgpC [Myxococcota bacterium]